MSRLKLKAVLVTGTGGGVGWVICERSIAEGARISATDIDCDAMPETVTASANG